MNKLKPNCLNFIELLAQNIALISPTMTAALIVPLMFSISGNMSWLSYAIGTIMLLFVAFNLNQFAKRTTNSGSMYTCTSSALGFTGGALCGWCLVWSYLFIGLAGTTGFTIFAGKLLEMIHITAPPVLLFAICLGTCFVLAYFDIKVSTLVMLGAEAFSCFLILLLCLIIMGHHHFIPDATQFSLKGLSLSSLGMGVVVAVFSLVGFESSTAFGEEAVNPLKTIPRSIIWSLVLTGLFFIFVCYSEVLGIQGYKDTLDKVDAPLNVLSGMYGVPFLSPLLSAGAMFSFFHGTPRCLSQIHERGAHEARHPARCAGRHGRHHVRRRDCLQVRLRLGGAGRIQQCRDNGCIRISRRLLSDFARGAGVSEKTRRTQGQRHRALRGGGGADDHSGRGHVCSIARPARAIFPLRFRRLSILRLRPGHGHAASEAATRRGNPRRSQKDARRNRLILWAQQRLASSPHFIVTPSNP